LQGKKYIQMEIEGNTESTYGTTAASKIEGWDVKIASNSAGATCAEKYKGDEFHNLCHLPQHFSKRFSFVLRNDII
jgi:hypothetical protein